MHDYKFAYRGAVIWTIASCLLSSCTGELEAIGTEAPPVQQDLGSIVSGDAGQDAGVIAVDSGSVKEDSGVIDEVDMAEPLKPALPTDNGLKRMSEMQYRNTLHRTTLSLFEELERKRYYIDSYPSYYEQILSDHETLQGRSDSPGPFDAYFELALREATQAISRASDLKDAALGLDEAEGKGVVEAWLREHGHVVFRRPIREQEVAFYRDEVMRYPVTEERLRELYAALLLSPHFSLRFEVGQELDEEKKRARLTPYELASRLSYFLWQGPPDEELFALAKDGTLDDPDMLRAQVARMLMDEKSDGFLEQLGLRWLGIDRQHFDFSSTQPSQAKDSYHGMVERRVREYEVEFLGNREHCEKSPGSGTYIPSCRAATLYNQRYLNVLHPYILDDLVSYLRYTIVTQQGSLEEVMTTPVVTSEDHLLYELYGVSAPWDGLSEPPRHETERGGLLGRLAFLSTPASRTRPIIRGEHIRHAVLCNNFALRNVPDDVEFKAPPFTPYSTRQLVEHTTSETECAGCHKALNGLGFAFSHYGVLGERREQEYFYYNRGLYDSLPDAQKGEIAAQRDLFIEEFNRRTGVDWEAENLPRPGDGRSMVDWPRVLPVSFSGAFKPYIDGVQDEREMSTAVEVGEAIGRSEDAAKCLAKHLIGFGLDGAYVPPEQVDAFGQMIHAQESVVSVIEAIVLSEAFVHKEYGAQFEEEQP